LKEYAMESPAFPPESERSMVDFMNEHYAHSNLMYARVYGQLWQATEARMVALDKEGMELDVTVADGTQRIRIPFAQRVQDEGDVQQTLVEMSFNARDVLAQQARQNG
jgi:putative heme iron utilization protein